MMSGLSDTVPRVLLLRRLEHSIERVCWFVIWQIGERSVELKPVPDDAAVNALRFWHATVGNEFVELGDAKADIRRGGFAAHAAGRVGVVVTFYHQTMMARRAIARAAQSDQCTEFTAY